MSDLSEFHDIFFDECSEGLDVMESGLLELNEESDVEEINAIFRAAHSIKGGGAAFGFMDISNFTHVMETLLDEMRDGRRVVERKDVDLLLRSVDILRQMIDSAKIDEACDTDVVSEVQKELEGALATPTEGSVPVEADTVPDRVECSDEPSKSQWQIVYRPSLEVLKNEDEPSRVFNTLREMGDVEVIADDLNIPSLRDFEPQECHIGWTIHLNGENITRKSLDEVGEWLSDEAIFEVELIVAAAEDTAVASTEETERFEVSDSIVESDSEECTDSGDKNEASQDFRKEEKPEKKAAAAGKESGGSIRVATGKVDELINMVGELVITQSMLSEIGQSVDEGSMKTLERLRDGLDQLERNTRELQESVLQIRMLPVSFSFNRFPRLVRDLSSKLGKKIELKMTGEQTEVDKTVLEKIGDPLVHLIRNSIDHGIEMPEERHAAGKDETGTLELCAYHEGGDIVIQVIDDGGGLDRERILEKAVQKGLVQRDEELTDERIYNLIFAAGFSTAEQLSDVSGRGVGMDVVRRNVRDLGGNVSISSNAGAGSTVTIRLPLTLAILDGQLIRVGGQTYIVSLVSIVESLLIRPEKICSVADKSELYRLRDEHIQVIRVDQLFGQTVETSDLSEGLLMVVESDGKRFGLVVDELLGQQQVVIKSLETNFRQVQGISGATILGDGTVSLIVDVPGLIARHFEACASFEQKLTAVA